MRRLVYKNLLRAYSVTDEYEMNVGIRCFSILRDFAGASVLHMDLPDNARIGDLLDKLKEAPYSRLGSFITDDSGELKPYVKLVRNGELQTAGGDEHLHDGDEFHLFVATSGG